MLDDTEAARMVTGTRNRTDHGHHPSRRTHLRDDHPAVPVRTSEETKPSIKTTELIVHRGEVAGVLVAATMDDNPTTLWAWILISTLAVGYMLSRGLAKSGSQHLDSH